MRFLIAAMLLATASPAFAVDQDPPLSDDMLKAADKWPVEEPADPKDTYLSDGSNIQENVDRYDDGLEANKGKNDKLKRDKK